MKYIGVSTPAFTIPHTKKETIQKLKKEDHTPGYPENIPFLENSDTPYWTIPKNEKNRGISQISLKTPGPGTYFEAKSKVKEKEPAINYRRKNKKPFISGALRFKKKRKKEILGPGSYNYSTDPGEDAVKYSFGYKFDTELPVPKKKGKRRAKSQQVTNDTEGSEFKKITPGPGDYEPEYTQIEISKGAKFPKSGVKNDIQEKENVLQSTKKKNRNQSTKPSPGPGDYDINIHHRDLESTQSYTSQKGTFGSKDDKRFKDKMNKNPGVGSYLLDNDTIKTRIHEMRRKGKSSSKDKEKLRKIKMRRARTQKEKVNSFTLKQNLKNEYLRNNNIIPDKRPGYSIGDGLRPPLAYIDMEIPGPGKYLEVYKKINQHLETKLKLERDDFGDTQENLKKEFPTFGKSVRKPLNLLGKDTPGPGNYKAVEENKVYKSTPAYSIAFKRKKNHLDLPSYGPGPGAYPIEKIIKLGRSGYRKENSTFPKAERFKGPRLRKAKKKFFDESDKNYPVDTTLRLSRKVRRVSERLSKSVNHDKDDFKYDSSPGPGEYDITGGGIGTGFAKPFSLQNIKYRNAKSVGRRYEAMLYKINGTKFGKSLRRGPATVDPDIEVGPGSYDLKNTIPQLQPFEEMAKREAGFQLSII